jgi:hypothetical protein
MWSIELPHWSHFIVRAVVVYVFLLVLLRFTGKRQVGQLAPFDLVLLLVLSNAVHNAMNGGDNNSAALGRAALRGPPFARHPPEDWKSRAAICPQASDTKQSKFHVASRTSLAMN